MKIRFKEKEIELRQSMRALLAYENISNKNFEPKNLTDILTYMYCIVLTSSKDYSITFDEFIDYIDENQ